VRLRDHHRLPGRSRCRPPRSRRTGRSATSHEVSLFASLRRSPAAPFRLGGDRPPDHPAAALVRIPHRRRPRRGCSLRTRPCGFWRLASPVFAFSDRGDVARAGHSWPPFLRRTFRARGSGCYRGLADLLSEFGDARGVRFGPSQCRSGPRVTGVSSMPIGPTCRFAAAPSASVFVSRGPTVTSVPPGAGGCGSWVSLRGRAVPRVPPVPPRLLRTGPDAPRWLVLPWAFGPLSGVRRWPLRRHSWRRTNTRGLGRDAAI
jgi:hypothetical protein